MTWSNVGSQWQGRGPLASESPALRCGRNLSRGRLLRAWFVGVLATFCASATLAAPLDPLDPLFNPSAVANGVLAVTTGNSITINTDTLAISGFDTAAGVEYVQPAGGPNVAVFNFTGIDIAAGATVTVTGTRPLALLSQSDTTIGATIATNGGNGATNSGATGGAGGPGGPGGGAGGKGGNTGGTGLPGTGSGRGIGGNGTGGAAGGGGSGAGFGGAGGSGYLGLPASGIAYGNLLDRLEAGSGGGGGGGVFIIPSTNDGGSGGGGGGGAIEIGAVGAINLASVMAQGGAGLFSGGRSGGGGSGGALLVHGAAVNVTGSLSARGGQGDAPDYGGGGGGGRLAVLGWTSYTLGDPVSGISVNGAGGVNSGKAGVVTLGPNPSIVPAGRSIVLNGIPFISTAGSTLSTEPTIELLIQRDLTVQAGGRATWAASNVLSTGAALAVAGTGLVDLAGFTQTVATLSGDGDVRISGGGSLAVGSGNATSIFAGRINGAGGLQKTGSGTLTLSGINSYMGSTQIDQGTLVLNNSLTSPGGAIAIASDATLQASGVLQRSTTGLGTIVAGGTLLIGDVTSSSGFDFAGSLQVGSQTVQLLDADAAALGGSTVLATAGRLASLNGINLGAGKILTASGAAEIAGKFTNQGTINGPVTVGQFLTFTDDVNGAGNYTGNVAFSDGFSPGNSPAAVSLENMAFDASTTLTIELGGLAAGTQYDRLDVSALATLGGTLDVDLIDGFTPGLGNQFAILTFGSRSGDFASYSGLNVGGHLALRHSFTPTSLILKARPTIDGDINLDGTVNIFDINAVSSNWNTAGPQGDANGDGIVNIFDINLISSNWGASGGGGLAAVPEPSTWLLASIAFLGFVAVRSRLAARNPA